MKQRIYHNLKNINKNQNCWGKITVQGGIDKMEKSEKRSGKNIVKE